MKQYVRKCSNTFMTSFKPSLATFFTEGIRLSLISCHLVAGNLICSSEQRNSGLSTLQLKFMIILCVNGSALSKLSLRRTTEFKRTEGQRSLSWVTLARHISLTCIELLLDAKMSILSELGSKLDSKVWCAQVSPHGTLNE